SREPVCTPTVKLISPSSTTSSTPTSNTVTFDDSGSSRVSKSPATDTSHDAPSLLAHTVPNSTSVVSDRVTSTTVASAADETRCTTSISSTTLAPSSPVVTSDVSLTTEAPAHSNEPQHSTER